MMGYGSRYDPGYPPPPGRGGYDPRPPHGYDPRFDAFDPPMGGPGYGARGLPPLPPQGRGGKQNKITPENKKKAAKLGAKAGKFGALFGFGKLKENVDMGEFEGFADKYGEDAIGAMGDHIEGAIDKADFGGFDNSRQPGRMQSRHLQDVVERRARELSPDRGPAGPRGSYMDGDLDHEPYLPRIPRNYDRGPLPPEDYPRDQRDADRRNADPRNFDQGPPVDFNRGSRSNTGLHDQLDNESRFGDVAYKDVPVDVRKAYERKLREQNAINDPERPTPRDRNEDDRSYFMYPQGFSIQPRKSDSPPPSYNASAQHPAMRYPSDEPIIGPDPAFPMPGQLEYDRPSNQLTHYRSY